MSDDFTDENKKENSFKQEEWDRSNATNENNTENKIIIQDNNNLQINYNMSTNNEITLNNKYDANKSSDNSLKAVKDIKTNPQKKNKKNIKKRRKKINLDEPIKCTSVKDPIKNKIKDLKRILKKRINLDKNKVIKTKLKNTFEDDKKIKQRRIHVDEIQENKPLSNVIYEVAQNTIQNEELLESRNYIKERFDTQIEENLEMIKKYCENRGEAEGSKIYAAASKIHGIGIFADEEIQAGQLIIEYVGEKIGKKVADKREKFYQNNNIRSIYLFKISDDLIIDATLTGNLARFINHSCVPNAYTKIEEGKICIYGRKEIKKDEEITFFYNFSSDDANNSGKIPCFCGHELCSKFIV